MQPLPENERNSGTKSDAAREHGEYAEGEAADAEPRPREAGDYDDPVKRLTGAGNASKGPWKEQGGAGHGEDYGARDPDPSIGTGENDRDKP